ncbi:MAG: PIN domain-containing protein [Bifidobacteriaceae bacterium]|nr:PIN domain-containing protein [Bifidobacteriaceae bacterium]
MTGTNASGGRVFDASALLAYVFDEPGAAAVRLHLRGGPAACSAANWSELAQKVHQKGQDWALAKGLLAPRLTIEPVTAADAEAAALLWRDHPQLSLGDRLCLALASRLGWPALTADAAWLACEGTELIRPAPDSRR